MERSDWVLLALREANEGILQPVQLQKALFLVAQREPPRGAFYEFQPYDYGPFSREVYDDADRLAQNGHVRIVPAPGIRWRHYEITERGAERADRAKENAPPATAAYLKAAVSWTESLSFKDLVKAIYAYFPEYKTNSVFQG